MHWFSHRNAKPEKTCAVLRYGGIGDHIQASSILPWLKEQGYWIDFYCVPEGYEVIRHDPHVDRFIVQDVDAVPNPDLGEFWSYTAKKYDKFINLSESVERNFLAMPFDRNHNWAHEVRHKYMNRNYMEFVHDVAGVPMPPRIRFYPTRAESDWAFEEIEEMRGKAILWVLSGSAVHKVWPYLDMAIDFIMRKNDGTHIVLVGDRSCKKLEEGWESVHRVHCRSGVWSLRETMAFARSCDLVIGPETGVLNAVSMESTPKIVTLSHSSIENLTRDWKNCTTLVPRGTKCYPCHRIIFDWSNCNQSKDVPGIAQCQADISLDQMLSAIESWAVEERVAA